MTSLVLDIRLFSVYLYMFNNFVIKYESVIFILVLHLIVYFIVKTLSSFELLVLILQSYRISELIVRILTF